MALRKILTQGDPTLNKKAAQWSGLMSGFISFWMI